MSTINESSIPSIEKELYFLILKFLENGPCQFAAESLRKEIEDNQLVEQRKDWLGKLHEQSFTDFEKLHQNVQSKFLLQILNRVGPLVQTCYPVGVGGISSLLATGSFSLLRQDGLLKASNYVSTARHSAVKNTVTPLLPQQLKKLSIVPLLNGRSLNGTCRHSNIRNHANIFEKYLLHKQTLGHLASVYCVLYDQTGLIIATGADDNLVKLWSAVNGRLVATLRGHAAQITDISINKENTFVASGSLDKTVRVWNLQNTYPVAVLQGHTGMITSLHFCPSADKTRRYLVSTGGDGHICFWAWSPDTQEFNLEPIRFNEKSRAGAQLLCSTFSPGGSFLVTGSSDNCIRVYKLYPDRPEKLVELTNHKDHVDSIIYSNHGDRFLSGSRDGSIMVWKFTAGYWQSKAIDISKLHRESKPRNEIEANDGVKVIMICWNCNDHYITASTTDLAIRTWNSHNFSFLRSYHGHTDEVFLLESHPTDPFIFLSGGHDGNIILWSMRTGEKIRTFFNSLEGQGHGAIFDLKFSPTGDQFCATDGHGHLMIYGYGKVSRFDNAPYEQFFHTDYRPIIRDANNYVLDEQTQTAPHLLPPPFLVDVDGNPHTANHQMLIPGRTSSNLPHLRQNLLLADQGLPPLMAEIQAAEAAQRNLLSPGIRSRQNSHSDLMSPNALSGGGGLGLRESGDVEGVRQQNNLYISGDITETDIELWRNRTIVRASNLINSIEDDLRRLQQGVEEIQIYLREVNEGKKRNEQDEMEMFSNEKPFLRNTRSRGRGRGTGRGRSGKVRQLITYTRESAMRSNSYTASGREVVHLDSAASSSDSEPEDWQGESSETASDSSDDDWPAQASIARKSPKKAAKRVSGKKNASSSDENATKEAPKRSKRKIIKNRKYAESSVNSSDIEGSNSSSSSTSEAPSNREAESSDNEIVLTKKKPSKRNLKKYSREENTNEDNDVEIGSKRLLRKNARQKKLRVKFSDNESSDDVSSKLHNGDSVRKTTQNTRRPRTKTVRQLKKEYMLREPPPPTTDVNAYLNYYRPPDWLLSKETQKFPYVPQIGDEVYYLLQGHKLYVEAVLEKNVYNIQEGRQAYSRYDLEAAELCRLVGVIYDVGPPKMCSLKLELMNHQKQRGARKTVTVRFHDMPTVVDFLVLRHIYEKSLAQDWSAGRRFRCIIDDIWYHGLIESVTPYQDDFPTSSFLCVNVRWDSGEEERLSPWDLEQPDEDEEDESETRPVTKEDISLFKYVPISSDWPNEGVKKIAERVSQGLEDFSQEEIAAPFAFPVNVEDYPTYWSIIAFPTDLETIKIRLRNHFYRRMEALLWEIRQLKQNANKFNEQGSEIVTNATYIVKLLTKFIRDPSINNLLDLHKDMMEKSSTFRRVSYGDHESEDDDIDVFEDYQEEHAGSNGGSSYASQVGWLVEAKSLLDFISSKDDAHPFLEAVDPEVFPDYRQIITEPIDLSVIRHRLDCHQYDSPDAYIHDFRLMFRNSKTYNTDRRSLIYKMTLRLSALFEARCSVIREAYNAYNNTKIHWTRNKTRKKAVFENSLSLPQDIISPRHRKSSSSLTSPTDGLISPRKGAITLQDFVHKPSARSNQQENGLNNRQASTSSADERTSTQNLLSPDVVRQTLRSGRISVKKRRYGFESDEEVERSKPKKKCNIMKKTTKKNKKTEKVSKVTTVIPSKRITRKKTTVNYCDDYYDDEEEIEKEVVSNGEVVVDGNESSEKSDSSSSSTTEDEEIKDEESKDEESKDEQSKDEESEDEESEENSEVYTSVSSRGRVRKAARRFNDL